MIVNSNNYHYYMIKEGAMSRRTKQRDTILKVVMNTKSHPRADWVYEQVRREIPNISLGTVYRNLRSLAQSGEIRQLDLADGTSRFDGNSDSHYHFRCDRCGLICDLDEPVDKSIGERVAKKTGFKISRQRMELLGLCTKCRRKE
jgi:Fur family transcriptional regulator, peroxide stress response regulator